MRQGLAPVPEAGNTVAPETPQALRTEFEFDLPRGYVDRAGTVHRHGVMRLATADVPSMPYAPALESAVLITADRIADAARRLLQA